MTFSFHFITQKKIKNNGNKKNSPHNRRQWTQKNTILNITMEFNVCFVFFTIRNFLLYIGNNRQETKETWNAYNFIYKIKIAKQHSSPTTFKMDISFREEKKYTLYGLCLCWFNIFQEIQFNSNVAGCWCLRLTLTYLNY